MPKRKRSEPKLEDRLEEWETKLARGLKAAKGYERQALAKRMRLAAKTPEKLERLQHEVQVLKSLDLHQFAHAHLCSTLLKNKGIADSPNLPQTIRPVSKPTLSQEEQTAFHNVTSGLANRKEVREVTQEAVMGVCIALRVPMPDKKRGGKKSGRQEPEEQAADRKSIPDDGKRYGESKQDKSEMNELAESEESWEGFGSDTDVKMEGEVEEETFSKFDGLIGNSSDESEEEVSDDDDDDALNSRARVVRRTTADDISISGSEEASDAEMQEDIEDESEEDTALRPPDRTRAKAPTMTGNSTFLPSLMGGYISGSESEASDIDVAPPARKNRRGQRARQAIWEKKFGDKAKHKHKPQGGRDDGWDMKRGAVGAEDAGPWKKGIHTPFERRGRTQQAPEGVHASRHGNFSQQNGGRGSQHQPRHGGFDNRPKPPPKIHRDDTGPLHSSWAAAKHAKEAEQNVKFAGKKVTFD